MSTEQTRKTIESFVAAFKTQDFDALDALATPTATYQFRGPPDSPLAGVRPYAEFIASQRQFLANACHAFETEQTGAIFVEGAHGAVESRARFEDKSGKVYANEAMMKFVVDNEGKIEEIREYEDSVPILKFLGKTYFGFLVVEKFKAQTFRTIQIRKLQDTPRHTTACICH